MCIRDRAGTLLHEAEINEEGIGRLITRFKQDVAGIEIAVAAPGDAGGELGGPGHQLLPAIGQLGGKGRVPRTGETPRPSRSPDYAVPGSGCGFRGPAPLSPPSAYKEGRPGLRVGILQPAQVGSL